jgi:DNA segregation ATPase FtsK/SpoIIIE-like protein
VGSGLAFTCRVICGLLWSWAAPVWLLWRGTRLLLRGRAPLLPLGGRLAPLWLASTAWLAQPAGPLATGEAARWGGAVGWYLAGGFHSLFGRWGGRIFLTFLLLSAALLVARPWLAPLMDRLAPLASAAGAVFAIIGRTACWLLALPWRAIRGLWSLWRGVGDDMARWRRRRRQTDRAAVPTAPPPPRDEPVPAPAPRKVHMQDPPAAPDPVGAAPPVAAATRTTRGGGSVSTALRVGPASAGEFPEADGGLVDPGAAIPLPDLSLLNEPPAGRTQVSAGDLNASADLLEETLRSFGVEGTVKDVRPGPVVTTFEYQPASGIKVNAIVQRSDDLALAMKARSIRMEAPIPGKAAVGIEIPNPSQDIVSMKEVFTLAADRLRRPLSVVLGRDVFGDPVSIDLADQPHLLVAGATGSGKSVCINAMICSLLLRCDPSVVRLLLIDPKMLELNVYNDVPHLLTPVVTDPKEALRSLKWMEAQMDHRYRRLSRHGVRNIEAYNQKVAAGGVTGDDGEPVNEPMPYYVCIVDELADLMVQLGQEIELPITRLAQKARAVGIHLVLATQRPSVDVLTGVIKANIPCRIAFRVIQKNDSRTILDANGAEKLLGKGDMLYLQPGRARPVRLHGAYLDVAECEAIAAHWRAYSDATRHIALAEERDDLSGIELESDPLFERAREIVVLSQHGSTSMLQRKLQVGYARAGRLMDLLEQAGVVGPFIGSKAREVLMKPDMLDALEAADGEELP